MNYVRILFRLTLFLITTSLFTPLLMFAQSIDIDVVAEPFPTPFVSDWDQDPNIFNATITNNEATSIIIDIKAEITRNNKILGNGTSTNIKLDAFEVKNLDNIEFLESGDWNYNSKFTDGIAKTGKLPEGEYEICLSYTDKNFVVTKGCASFEIVIPDIPDLIDPIDDTNVEEMFPRFEWTPSFVPTEMGIEYRIIVCPVEDGENFNYSITKVPIWDEQTIDNSIIYPTTSPPLDNGRTYVWQIQLLDKNSMPTGENEGKSEIGSFVFDTVQTTETGVVLTVNDGLEEDIDWSNLTTVSGNWVGESEDVYYSVGSTAGNTDILAWTYGAAMKSFTIPVNLAEGAKYFVNAKDGENGAVNSSNGCQIDRTPPVSSVDSLADSSQTPFDVKWTAVDSASGVQQITIQSRVKDSTFTDWVTVGDSLKSKSFTGKTEKFYYFQSKAQDYAGNMEEYPDSADASTYVKKPDDSTYVLVPNVSYLKLTDSTKVKTDSGKTVISGQVKLVIEPSPFDNFEKTITLADTSGIAFKINNVTNELEPIEGSLSISDSAGIKKVYKEVLKIVSISFDSKRPTNSKMMVDSAFITMPFDAAGMKDTKITSLDSIPITAAGLAFNKTFSKEWSKWGMTFTFKKFALAAEAAPPYIEAIVNVKLNKSDSDSSDNFATNATIGFRGKNDIFAHIVPDSIPMRLIPGKDYVMMDSIWFEKPADEWKLGVALQFKYPAPLDSITEQSKVNLLIGDDGFDLQLALINETRKATYDPSDKTAFRISNYFAMDLTNVDLRLKSVQNNGKMVLDKEHSYVEFMADVYLGKGTPKRIAIGYPEENKPGFKVTFDGNTTKPGFKIVQNPFDIGPIRLSGFTNGTGIGIDFEPFEISLSGGLGVNKPGTFEGTVNFENLKINRHGLDFSEFQVLGGDITIMDVITASIDSIGYSADPTTLTFKEPQGDTVSVKTVEVDNYFRLAGASLGLNIGGDGGGGGCDEFLLYEVNNSTNIVIRKAWFEIKNSCRLEADLTYIENPEPLLNFGGNATIKSSGIKGVAIGKIGKRDGKPTFGIFLAASGLNATLGPVVLDEIGGGIFYRPLQSDIDRVKVLVGLKGGSLMQNDISEMIQSDMPSSDNLNFAIMLYAGIYVTNREVLNGNALITLTNNYFELLAKAKMLENKAEGNLQLLVSWDPGYAEGFLGFKLEEKKVLKINQNIEFFSYSDEVPGLNENIWAVMGNGNVEVFPSTISGKLTTDFFLGPPGFYFAVDIEKDHNYWIVNGSYDFQTMFWWQKNVSWGAYAKVHASLKIDHVAGVGAGLEGALIGVNPDVLLYSVGSVRVTLLGEDVYSGSLWLSIGTNGTHGGKGRNSTYDGYIEDAKNMANNMQNEINNLSEDITQAKESALLLTEGQRSAAGQTLYNIASGDNIIDIQDLKNKYTNDVNNYHSPNNNLKMVFNDFLFFSEVQIIKNMKNNVENDSLEIDANLETLNSNSDALIDKINTYTSHTITTLPQLSETILLSNPVDTGSVVTVNINGDIVEMPTNVNIDTEIVNQNIDNTSSLRENIGAYKDSMLAQADHIVDDLIFADQVLYSGNNSVNSISIDHYRHSFKLSQNTAAYLMYYKKIWEIYGIKWGEMRIRNTTNIFQDIEDQANNISESEVENLISNRLEIINYLLTKAGKTETTAQDITNLTSQEKIDYCISLGKEVWYNIPLNGMMAISQNAVNGMNGFISVYNNKRNQGYQNWTSIANRTQTIHNIKKQTYEYLYDLYDDLSWEYEGGGADGEYNGSGASGNTTGMKFGGAKYSGYNGTPKMTYSGSGKRYSGNNYAASQKTYQTNTQVKTQYSGKNYAASQQTYHTNAQVETPYLGLAASMRLMQIGGAASKIREYTTYSDKRDYIGSISSPPNIKKFTAKFDSDDKTYRFGLLSLDYSAEHLSEAGCFYNLDIPNVTSGPISLGTGETPSFYLFRQIDPTGSYNINLTSLANSGYGITSNISLPVDYYTTPFEGQGGEFHSEENFEDTSSPMPPVFTAAYYLASQDVLAFNYQSEDPESGISEYQYAVADSVWYEFISYGAPPIRKVKLVRTWQSTGGRTDDNVKSLTLEHGESYYILGKAKNGKDLWSAESVSDKITVDKTPPASFNIIDFQIKSLVKIGRSKPGSSNQNRRLSAGWSEAADPESDVIYVVGLGSSQGSDDLINFAPVYSNQTNIEQNFVLSTGISNCYLTVKALNSAGLSVVKSEEKKVASVVTSERGSGIGENESNGLEKVQKKGSEKPVNKFKKRGK